MGTWPTPRRESAATRASPGTSRSARRRPAQLGATVEAPSALHPLLVAQNKWRAARYGAKAQLVDASTYQVQTLPQIVDNLVERLAATAEDLGCREYLERNRQVAAGPSWAERQLTLAEQKGELAAVVKELIQQSRVT